VDRGGKDNNMQCADLGVRNVRVKLASTQDIEADRWQKPAQPQIPTALTTFAQGKTVQLAQHAVQYTAFTTMVPENRKKLVASIEQRKTLSVRKFKSTSFSVPAKQIDIIKKRQDVNLMKIQKPMPVINKKNTP
jgi:hypothetical protein